MTMLRPQSTSKRYLTYGIVGTLAVWGAFNLRAADTLRSADTATTADHADRKDTSFIKEAAQGNLSEVEVGKLAVERGQNSLVKQLGQRLQDDHAKSNQELTQIAQHTGVTLPDQAKKEHAMTKLEGKTGTDFDKAFAEHALMDHEKDIRKYQKALQDVKDPQLQAYISKSLPVLRQHLELARAAGSAVGVDQKALTAADNFLSEHSQQGLGTAPSSQRGTGTTTGPSSGTTSGSTSGNRIPGQSSRGINDADSSPHK